MASMPPINDWVNVAAVRSELAVILPQWATANRKRQGALTESRTTIENGFVARVRAVGVVYWSASTSITACL